MSHFSRGVVFSSAMLVIAATAACSSSSSGGGGGGLPCTAAGGNCSLAAGTYTVHFTLAPGSNSNCPAIADQTSPVAMNATAAELAGGVMGSSAVGDAGSCTTSSGSACTATVKCSLNFSGVSENVTANIGVGMNDWCGVETVVASAQGRTLNCTYDISVHM